MSVSDKFDTSDPVRASSTNSIGVHSSPASSWQVRPISCIDDLYDAVLGGGIIPTQMSHQPAVGSLAFSTWSGLVFSSAWLKGKVSLKGSLYDDLLTVGTGLILDGRCQHWLHDIEAGTVGVFGPGEDHDAIYSGQTLYIGVALPKQRLHSEAEQRGVVIDPSTLQTGLSNRPMLADSLGRLRNGLLAVHMHGSRVGSGCIEEAILNAFLEYLGRPPQVGVGLPPLRGHERIVGRARDWILAHLEEAIHIDQIAAAALTSRRTLHRAFLEVLDESPQAYVRRLRLHRIRAELASDKDAICNIAGAANRWGIGELGRLSARYRTMFGELPSETAMRSYRSS